MGFLALAIVSSCSQDEKVDSSIALTESRNFTESLALSNEEVAKVVSNMVCDQVFNQILNNMINTSYTSSYNSITFMELISGSNSSTFCQKFRQSCEQLNISNGLSKFINVNLKNRPNLCLSIYTPSGPSNQIQNLNYLPVFSEQIFDAIPENHNYTFYKCGTSNGQLTTSTAPNFKVCVIQEREGFTSLLSSMINNMNYFNVNSKVLYNQAFINSTNFQALNFNQTFSSNTLTLCGVQYTNPFVNRYFINEDILTSLYNTAASNMAFPPPNPPSGDYLCQNGLPSQRTTFNTVVNDEFSHSIQLPLGNETLELNNDWCAWWNRHCRFMIDLYVPSKFNSDEYEPIHITKFASYRENDLKAKKFVTPAVVAEFVPWQYESGQHGNEWKYNWTGKHRKEGDSFTITLGNELGSSIEFKNKTGSGVGLTKKATAGFSTTRTNKDIVLGGDLVYWCDDILVNNNKGHQYSTGDILFHIREKQ